jgi:hypothetical protein
MSDDDLDDFPVDPVFAALDLAEQQHKQGDLAAARATLEAVLDPSVPAVSQRLVVGKLARVEEAAGRPAVAEEYLRRLPGWPGLPHHDRAETCDRLAEFLDRRGRHADSLAAAAEGFGWRARLLDDEVLPFFGFPDGALLERVAAGRGPTRGESVLLWSFGPISVPEILDDSGRPVHGGLRCCRTFGPTADHTCWCGKHRGIAEQGTICQHCGVEVLSSQTRRWRTGHLKLPSPLFHPGWAPLARQLLGLAPGAPPPPELDAALDGINVYQLRDDVLHDGSPVARAFSEPGAFHPRHLAVTVVPVLPPEGVLPSGRSRDSVEAAYRELLVSAGQGPTARAQSALDAVFALFQP